MDRAIVSVANYSSVALYVRQHPDQVQRPDHLINPNIIVEVDTKYPIKDNVHVSLINQANNVARYGLQKINDNIQVNGNIITFTAVKLASSEILSPYGNTFRIRISLGEAVVETNFFTVTY
jgi:hypothetical protein